ncbi:DUF5791 family protein [Halosegnis longus]|uniref:DUF5791 family protein n=1 Tax=Halosegnis longus TaxID=2216012 RepID=UPI00096AC47E|nr:DUF5791 family protein [Salella cibi]
MLHDLVADPGDHSGTELYDAMVAELAAGVESVGVDAIAAETDVPEATLRDLVAGDQPELTVEEAAAILAVVEDDHAGDIVALSRDAIMMGMSQAVLDVEALAADAGDELEPREVQSKIEGRFPMTLREFALFHATIQAQTV